MIRLLTLASLLLISALAVNAQAAECDAEGDPETCNEPTSCGPEYGTEAQCLHSDVPTAPCDGEVCTYGDESCIWCSGPILDDEAPATPTRDDCENCRTLHGDEPQSKGAPGSGLFAGLAAVAAALIARRK